MNCKKLAIEKTEDGIFFNVLLEDNQRLHIGINGQNLAMLYAIWAKKGCTDLLGRAAGTDKNIKATIALLEKDVLELEEKKQ